MTTFLAGNALVLAAILSYALSLVVQQRRLVGQSMAVEAELHKDEQRRAA